MSWVRWLPIRRRYGASDSTWCPTSAVYTDSVFDSSCWPSPTSPAHLLASRRQLSSQLRGVSRDQSRYTAPPSPVCVPPAQSFLLTSHGQRTIYSTICHLNPPAQRIAFDWCCRRLGLQGFSASVAKLGSVGSATKPAKTKSAGKA